MSWIYLNPTSGINGAIITYFDNTSTDTFTVPSTIQLTPSYSVPVIQIGTGINGNGGFIINAKGDILSNIINTSLTKMNLTINIPSSVITIADYAFTNIPVLNFNISLPNTLKTIGTYAFYRNSIREIIIPPNVNSIGDSAFNGSLLERIYFTGTPLPVLQNPSSVFNNIQSPPSSIFTSTNIPGNVDDNWNNTIIRLNNNIQPLSTYTSSLNLSIPSIKTINYITNVYGSGQYIA